MISVLLPSRGRPAALAESIASLRDTAGKRSVEILVAADPDDPDTIAAAEQLAVDHLWVAPERYGYGRLHEYVNALAARANREWLMLFNDDARMLTPHWDTVVERQQPGVLWPSSNDLPGCNTFPLWPRAWTTTVGHVSLSPHCDTWIQQIGDTLGQQQRIPVEILHDRADLTGGHNDLTRAESASGYRTAEFYGPVMQAALARDVETIRPLVCKENTP